MYEWDKEQVDFVKRIRVVVTNGQSFSAEQTQPRPSPLLPTDTHARLADHFTANSTTPKRETPSFEHWRPRGALRVVPGSAGGQCMGFSRQAVLVSGVVAKEEDEGKTKGCESCD